MYVQMTEGRRKSSEFHLELRIVSKNVHRIPYNTCSPGHRTPDRPIKRPNLLLVAEK